MARRRSRRCKYGKLKNPRGRRVCRLKPARRRRGWSEAARYKRDMQREFDRRENAAMGKYRRKRRR